MIFLDTSVLVEAASAISVSEVPLLLRNLMAGGARIGIPTLVHYEFLRGPRTAEEIAFRNGLFPPEEGISFGHEAAELSARFYRTLPRARSREFDFAIAATAVIHGASLWTLNLRDFSDVPELKLFTSPSGA